MFGGFGIGLLNRNVAFIDAGLYTGAIEKNHFTDFTFYPFCSFSSFRAKTTNKIKNLTKLDNICIICTEVPHLKPSLKQNGITDFEGIATVNGCTTDMERLSEVVSLN